MSFFSRIGVAFSEPSTVRGFTMLAGGIVTVLLTKDPSQLITAGALIVSGLIGAFVKDAPAPDTVESVVKDVVEVVKKAKKPKTNSNV